MAYRRITAAEAAEMINDGDMMALSGFTPNGNPKAIFRELSKRAIKPSKWHDLTVEVYI